MRQAPSSVDYRYERKFAVSQLIRQEIETLIKLHPAMFSVTYPPRYVNNIYLDSFGMKNYFDNVDGLKDRAKVRIRWYGDLFGLIEKPVLEIKIKLGSVGRKDSYPLNPFPIDKCLRVGAVLDVFKASDIPDALRLDLMSLELSLINRYRRQYFQSADGRYRITIDSGMEFYHVQGQGNTYLHKSVDKVNTVIELKYDPAEDGDVNQISNHFPFRITKNSKYVSGIERLSLW
jgi:hypothetical protein